MAESQALLTALEDPMRDYFGRDPKWHTNKGALDRAGIDWSCKGCPGMLRCRFDGYRDPTVTKGEEFRRVFVDHLLRWYLHVPDGTLKSDKHAYLLCLDKVRTEISDPESLPVKKGRPGFSSTKPFVVIPKWRRFVVAKWRL